MGEDTALPYGPSLHLAVASSPAFAAPERRNFSFSSCRDLHSLLVPKCQQRGKVLLVAAAAAALFLLGLLFNTHYKNLAVSIRSPLLQEEIQYSKCVPDRWFGRCTGKGGTAPLGGVSPRALQPLHHALSHRTLRSAENDAKEAKQSVLCLAYLAKNYALKKNTVEAE